MEQEEGGVGSPDSISPFPRKTRPKGRLLWNASFHHRCVSCWLRLMLLSFSRVWEQIDFRGTLCFFLTLWLVNTRGRNTPVPPCSLLRPPGRTVPNSRSSLCRTRSNTSEKDENAENSFQTKKSEPYLSLSHHHWTKPVYPRPRTGSEPPRRRRPETPL